MSAEAIATFTAALVALGLGLWPILQRHWERKQQRKIFRLQVLHYLHSMEMLLKKASMNEVVVYNYHFKESLRALETLWTNADLLEDKEFHAFVLVMSELVRHTRSGSLTGASDKNALAVIENAITAFEPKKEMSRQES